MMLDKKAQEEDHRKRQESIKTQMNYVVKASVLAFLAGVLLIILSKDPQIRFLGLLIDILVLVGIMIALIMKRVIRNRF